MCAKNLTRHRHKETKRVTPRENYVQEPRSAYRHTVEARFLYPRMQLRTITRAVNTDSPAKHRQYNMKVSEKVRDKLSDSERSRITGHPQRLARPSPKLSLQARSSRPLRSYDRKETRSEHFSLSTANSPDNSGARDCCYGGHVSNIYHSRISAF